MADFDQRELRNALGRFATGITVITTRGKNGKPEGLTANSFTALSLNPPLILWCLAKNTPSLEIFEQSDHFAVNILKAHQRHLSHQFATPAEDKFVGVDYAEGLGGAPLLLDCLAYFECRHDGHYEGGDHLIFIGKIEKYRYSEGSPLLFNAGRYAVAAEHPDNRGEVVDSSDFTDLLL